MIRSLVLGLAFNYHPYTYERFLASLRATGSDAHVVLFVGEGDSTPTLDHIVAKNQAKYLTVRQKRYHMNAYRFVWYADFLQHNAASYANARILLSDVRDVLFQSNPFTFHYKKEADLFFFEERRNIGACSANSEWIRECFGAEAAQELSACPILCAGTTIGNYMGILQYLQKMNEISLKRVEEGHEIVIGIDQAIHNYIYYKQLYLPFSAQVLNNENGPVNTLHYASKRVNADGYIINENDEVSCVAHQVDRLEPEVLEQIGQKRDLPVFDLLAQSRFLHGRE